MDVASGVQAMLAAQMAQTQMAFAAGMLRMNADAAGAIAQVIDAAQQNTNNLANVAAGIGQSVNFSA
jgi:hypothetical protein